MFVWMSKDPNGPRFTPELLGLADCFGHAGLLVGVVIVNKFLRKWKYRDLTLKELGKKTRIHKAIPPGAYVRPIQTQWSIVLVVALGFALLRCF